MRRFGTDETDDSLLSLSVGVPGTLGFVLLVIATGVAFVLPIFVFIIEAILVLAAVALLRETWIVEATTTGPPPERKAWKVRGPLSSKRAVEQVASELRAGTPAEPERGEVLPTD